MEMCGLDTQDKCKVLMNDCYKICCGLVSLQLLAVNKLT